jgi:hypothetical protein
MVPHPNTNPSNPQFNNCVLSPTGGSAAQQSRWDAAELGANLLGAGML